MKKSNLRVVFRLLPLVFLILLPACDEDDVPESTIRGQVVDSSGQSVAGAAILMCYDIDLFDGNGAKPTTSINFSIPESGRVLVYISEPCHGDTVKVLLDAEATAGSHAVRWRGDDTKGNTVVSGSYIVHMIYGEAHDTRDLFLEHASYAGRLTADGMNNFAVTDADGRFSFSQDCLAFGQELTVTNENGEVTGTAPLPHRATLWAIHDNHGAASGPANVTISPVEGASVNIAFADTPPYGDLRAFATSHWNVAQLDCAFDPGCADDALAAAGYEYIPNVQHYEDLPLWVDPVADEADFLVNIGRWSQFVFGWDDFLHPAAFMGDDYEAGVMEQLNDPRCSANREAYRVMLEMKKR